MAGAADRQALGRRAFLAGGALVMGSCQRAARTNDVSDKTGAPEPATANTFVLAPPVANAGDAGQEPDASSDGGSVHVLFDAYPALAKSLPRVELARFPSKVEQAKSLVADGSLWMKRDDDFTRKHGEQSELARIFGGGKVRKLELYFGEARAQGKRRIITSGGVGSNQALAVALLGGALGFSVRLYLAPQPASSLTAKNLAGDAASGAELRLFDSVFEAHARATREAKESGDVYVVPPGGTTPLGTLGFVNAGFELGEDVRARRLPAPRRVYVALGLGGSAVGLGIGCALAGLETEIVAVRASNVGTVSAAILRTIHDETIAFARARAPRFPALKHEDTNVRIDGRFVGAGYGVPTPAGIDAIARADRLEGLALDPVYTGKALAAILDDAARGQGEGIGPVLFWNTMSSRPVASVAAVPAAFQAYARLSR